MKKLGVFLVLLCTLGGLARAADAIPEDARRHMIRGRAALEMAKSPEDYRFAIEEFAQAVKLAPDWADAYYNLAVVQEKAGQVSDALASYRRYLELAPNASDAQKVQDEIVRLEYQLERQREFSALAGRWIQSHHPNLPPAGPAYVARTEGNRLILESEPHEPEGVEVTFAALFGAAPFEQFARAKVRGSFELDAQGLQLQGHYLRPAFTEEKSHCVFPELRTEAKGRWDPAAERIELRFTLKHYRGRYSTAPFSEVCSGVEAIRSEERTLVLVRDPHWPPGRVGMLVETDVSGAARIRSVVPGMPAALAGLEPGDRLIAVDGRPVKGLKPQELSRLLRGEPGTAVTITVTRDGWDTPREFTVERIGQK